ALIQEMKLLVGSMQKSCSFQRSHLRRLGKSDMNRRSTKRIVERPEPLRKCGLNGIGVGDLADKQSRACRWSERHRRLQLRIVRATGALERVGPAVVEDIFALAVTFQIARYCADELACGILEPQMLPKPTCASVRTAAFFKRKKKIIRYEWVIRDG